MLVEAAQGSISIIVQRAFSCLGRVDPRGGGPAGRGGVVLARYRDAEIAEIHTKAQRHTETQTETQHAPITLEVWLCERHELRRHPVLVDVGAEKAAAGRKAAEIRLEIPASCGCRECIQQRGYVCEFRSFQNGSSLSHLTHTSWHRQTDSCIVKNLSQPMQSLGLPGTHKFESCTIPEQINCKLHWVDEPRLTTLRCLKL